MTDEKLVTAVDFPRAAFPVLIQIYETATSDVVWEQTVLEPPVVIEVPGRDVFGVPVEVRVVTADGGYSDTQGNDGWVP